MWCSYPFRTAACLALVTGVDGCTTTSLLPAASNAELDPIAFFIGVSHGKGKLKKLFSDPVSVTVDSVGRREGGALIIDQTIREGSESPGVRRWTMQQIAPDHYTGTLTDAAGPIEVMVAGARANIRYEMDGGLKVNQQLALQSDGRTLLNRLQVTKLGVQVALLQERIRKLQ